MSRIVFAFLLVLIAPSFFQFDLSAQEEDGPAIRKKKGFYGGLWIGAYKAGKGPASFFDGYGYDQLGRKNNFYNSFMYQRIIMDYGGGNGQTDQVALALGVNHGEWTFEPSDMPVLMKYNPSITAGLQLNYFLNDGISLVLNANVARLSVSGLFSLVVLNPVIGPSAPGYQDIRAFAITGHEERTTVQFGSQVMLSQDDKTAWFLEGGMNLTQSEFARNVAQINSLVIDLGVYYTSPNYPNYRVSYLRQLNIGPYLGTGAHFNFSRRYAFQLLYQASYEKAGLGEDRKFSLQHQAGVRAYYRF